MKNTYFTPEMNVIDVRNEDVLTIVSGGVGQIGNGDIPTEGI